MRGLRAAATFLLVGIVLVLLGPGSATANGSATPATIAAGQNHTCAVTAAGAVECWGDGADGELGNGTTDSSTVPVAVSGLSSGVQSIAAGDIHTCVVGEAGDVECWGANGQGQLGDGTMHDRATPVEVTGLPNGGVQQIAAGRNFTCALTNAGAVYCWGVDSSGQLGDGSTDRSATPVAVHGLGSGVAAIGAGADHACAVLSSGTVECWGNNSLGQLGDGTTTSSNVPVAVSGISDATAVSVGADSTCALTSAGAVKCWGYNAYGQLGDGTTTNSDAPVAVSGLPSGVAAVALGGSAEHMCVVTDAGAGNCWGLNLHGQLGDGTTANSNVPVTVSRMTSGIASISVGGAHTCAASSDGGFACWGFNVDGEIGNGTTTDADVPFYAIVPDGTPNQAQLDAAAPDDSTSGRWGDMAGGNAARPYIESLSVTNGGVTTQVIENGTTSAPSVRTGGVTATVQPLNLCRQDQTPGSECYAQPNRVGITLAYDSGDADGYDFAAPSRTVTPAIDASSVVDVTIALNTLGKSLRWSWIDGDLLYWKTTDLGQDDATVEVKFHPVAAPYVTAAHASGQGCTATPITTCDIAHADGQLLVGQVVLSLDDTLDPALAGAAFATQNAIFGYLVPGGTTAAPSLDISASSSHLEADGSPELGTLQAFLPAAAILNLYGALPADDTTVFATTRAGDAGTNGTPTYANWQSGSNGSDGLLVTVPGITFSVPQYLVKGKLQSVKSKGVTSGKTAAVSATVSCSSKPCKAYLYDLGASSLPRYEAHAKAVLSKVAIEGKKLVVTLASSKLPAGDRYLLYLRDSAGKAIARSLGTMKAGTLPTVPLKVTRSGTGSGTVTSTPSGISCGSKCSHGFAIASHVTLRARPAAGSSFAGWSEACSSHRTTCKVTLRQASSAKATFTLRKVRQETLTVAVAAGTGSGTVTSDPAGIDCGSTCSASFDRGTDVTLAAAAATGAIFEGWSGACSGTDTCTVTMNGARSVTATFAHRIPAHPVACVVPTVKGRKLAAAKRALKAHHCGVGKVTHVRSKVRKGHVVKQKPRAGRHLKRGAKVALTVSKGKRR